MLSVFKEMFFLAKSFSRIYANLQANRNLTNGICFCKIVFDLSFDTILQRRKNVLYYFQCAVCNFCCNFLCAQICGIQKQRKI